jgi:lysophospholipase L1-like esterase
MLRTLPAIALLALTLAASAEPMQFGSAGPALTYVVLGDSTAAGVGTDYESGIAVQTARELAKRHAVTMVNLGVTGARMRDVRERQLPEAAALRPDVVLLSAGANDVTHLTKIRSVRSDLRAIVRELTAANPEVRIVITGAPDMGSPPRMPRLLRGIATRRSRAMNRMFRAEAAAEGLLFAEIAERAGPRFRGDFSLYADDGFHPNSRGYATWLPLLNEKLNEATR